MGKYWTNKTDNVDTVGAEIFNAAFDSIESDIQAIEGSAADMSQYVKKTDYATVNTPGVVTLAASGNPGNNPAVMTEGAVEEYLGNNNYIKRQEVPGALTAGEYKYIDGNTISAIAIQNFGSYYDMTNFRVNVLLAPAYMPAMTAITLASDLFKLSITDAQKSAALQNLGAAKESDVAYASQTASRLRTTRYTAIPSKAARRVQALLSRLNLWETLKISLTCRGGTHGLKALERLTRTLKKLRLTE